MKPPPTIWNVKRAHSSDGDTAVAQGGGAAQSNPIVPSTGDIHERRSWLLEQSSENDSENVKAHLGTWQERREKWVRSDSDGLASRYMQSSLSEKKTAHSNMNQVDWCEPERSVKSPPKHPHKKVDITKGRKALLQVSARAFEVRKKKKSSSPLKIDESKNLNLNSTPNINSNYHVLSSKEYETERKAGNLAFKEVFHGSSTAHSGETCIRRSEGLSTAGSTTSQCWRPCSSHSSCIMNENKDRIRRFEEAYRSIMLATNANCEDDEVSVSIRWLKAGGKRWTRDPHVSPAISIDGRLYDDLQRTPTMSLKQMNATPDSRKNYVESYNRAATWLSHASTPRDMRQSSVIEENNLNAEVKRGLGNERVKTSQALHNACREKLCDVELKRPGIENESNLELTQSLQTFAQIGLSPEKCQSMQHKCRKDNQTPPYGRGKMKEEGKTEVHICHCSEDCIIRQRDTSEPDHTDIDRAAPVGISTLRLLFAGVRNETKKSNEFNASCLMNYGVTRTLYQPHEPTHIKARTRSKQNNENLTHRKIWGTSTEEETGEDRRFVYTECARNSVGCFDVSSVGTYLREMNAVEIDHTKSKSSETLQNHVPSNGLFTDTIFHGQEIFQGHLNVANLVKQSLFPCQIEPAIIDTDSTGSDVADFREIQYDAMLHSMLMSPSLITKRYQQALNAIESRNWNQISYLINANPWLMEMKDVRNDQSLVHSLSLFCGGSNGIVYDDSLENTPTLPKQLVRNIIDYEPNVVHKLDIGGNLPLHLAAVSGNTIMIEELGRRFSGAASVQNHNGLLPLHLAIMSCDLFPTGNQSVELILAMFPGAVVVKDHDGNTPLHIAAGTLRGDLGADIINQLVEGCCTLMLVNKAFSNKNTSFARNSSPNVEAASIMMDTETPEYILPNDLRANPRFYLLKNNKGETPLARAIVSLSGRQVVEALLNGIGGHIAVLDTNHASQNALHLALDSNFHDAAVVLSILKSTPSTATIVDGKGMHPIQLACMNSLQHEIILAIAIIDLPINLGAKGGTTLRNVFGASWWYLLCESHDMYAGVIKDVISLCSHPQKIALCLTTAGSRHDSRVAVNCATPLCKLELRRSLLFYGRLELVGGEKKIDVFTHHVHKFDAIDYGIHKDLIQDEKKVSLVSYTDAQIYRKDAVHLQHCRLDSDLFEEISHFPVEDSEATIPFGVLIRCCVAFDKPLMSLASVVSGMPTYHRCRSDLSILGRYFGKSRSIMRHIAEALNELHGKNIIHGLVDSYHINKFGERWKITGLPGSVVRGEQFATCRLGLHSPPEAFVLVHSKHSHALNLASLAPSLKAEPTVDVW
eukprot:CAMPEP_0172321962 /NCGR_PEP_ID=MMETSP1058-20130122/44726_1 /TAXON_ID=83371 /ORGANISM="Detonula confervacea, Strain CCMP 353" /LENGTH=1322 /DNA_ID=CAMNT_0013037589 /DNA_START=174 /DNA_END=4139 /DNA_ORIENTATION=+